MLRLRIFPSNAARCNLEVVLQVVLPILGGEREARGHVGEQVAAQAVARTIFEVVPERVHQNGGGGDSARRENNVGSAMGETESTAGHVEDVCTTMGVFCVDLKALDDGVGSDHERMAFTFGNKMALMLIILQ